MKLRKLNSSIRRSLFAAALLLGLPFLCSEANAFRGSGAAYNGGSFRGDTRVEEAHGAAWPRKAPGATWQRKAHEATWRQAQAQ